MKVTMIAVVILAAFTGVSIWNYRRYFPKAKPLDKDKKKIDVQKLSIYADGHELYGELLRPKNINGKLPTIICSHGFNGSCRYFSGYVGKCLAMAGFAVYCFDFYGGSVHGKSGGSMTEMSVFTERDQLHDVIEFMKKQDFVDTDRLFLFGESMGGFVTAMTAAWHTEDVKAIVLYYPAFSMLDDIRKHYPTLDEMPEIIDVLGKKVGKVHYEKLYDFDAYAEASCYTGPVLIVHGDADRTVDVSYGRKAADCYKNACFKVLPGQDHGFNAKGKQQAAKLVYTFLKQHL